MSFLDHMTVLGIDAGFTAPGIAVVQMGEGGAVARIILTECFMTAAYDGADKKKRKQLDRYKSEDDAIRMVAISNRFREVVSAHKPDVAVIELPSAGGKSSGAVKGMAIGAAVSVTTLNCLDVPCVYITPRENKMVSTGDPFAEKEAMLSAAKANYPGVAWPRLKRGDKLDGPRCWAIADALGAITALRQRP